MKALRLGLTILAGLLLAVVAAVAWVIATESGTRWLIETASTRLPALTIDGTDGALAGGLEIEGLSYAPADSATRVEVRRAAIDLGWSALLRGVVHVERATIDGVTAVLGDGGKKPLGPQQQRSPLEPPIDVVIDGFELTDATVRNAGDSAPLIDVRAAQLAGRWTSAGIDLERLDLEAADGSVHLSGSATGGETWAVDSRGRFEWRIGAATYAGRLDIGTNDGTTRGKLALTAPFAAELEGAVQTASLDWQMTLDVPAFVPPPSWPLEGRFETVAADLSATGTRTSIRSNGRIVLDEIPLRIESAALELRSNAIAIEELVLAVDDRPQTLTASGTITTGDASNTANLDVSWQRLQLPQQWVGQTLYTEGDLDVSGTPDAFDVRGDVAAGPDVERLTQIALAVTGSTERLEIERLDVVQASGRLAASGVVDLAPPLRWDVTATASSFDPGELFAGWTGDIAFALATTGRLAEDGPQARIALESLDGRLRGRPISGRADLSVTPPNLAGELELASGESTLSVTGAPGESLDARIRVDVASLNDWLPAASGSVRGRFDLTGTWESLHLAGEADARDLGYGDTRADEASLRFDLDELRTPRGSAELRARNLEAGGLSFDTLSADVSSRSPDQHRLAVSVSGDSLDARLDVDATQREGAWSGSIDELTLDLAELDPLRLTEPVRFEARDGGTKLEPLCLAGLGEMRLCIDGTVGAGQRAQLHYELEAVPLGLVSTFAPELLPGDLEGSMSGKGELTRNPQGILRGRATLTSRSARLLFLPEADVDDVAGESLLLYENLEARLELEGTHATARLEGALGGAGRLRAVANLDGIGQSSTTLDGELDAELPTLAPLAPFVPQVTELAGRLDAELAFGGTLAAPQIDGRLAASQLAGGIPDLGLALHDGTLEITPHAGQGFAIDGGIESAEGRLTFDGEVALQGDANVSITGERFLAADLPAGKVFVSPDLQLERTAERLSLTGRVVIPSADVNVAKLPQGRPQQASPDVVIVDAKIEEEQSALPFPLHADIEVILGDDVEINAYGLEATLAGDITVTEAPDQPTLASGTIRVDGAYQAYGQDLTITNGQILFAGTPIDNPRLNIAAQRQIDNVSAGLRITGTAQRPEINVYSNPALGDAEALSYLVTGRPLAEIGTSEEDSDALASASRSLAGAAGGVLAEAVGNRLGIDVATVEDNEAVGGSVFTLGEYLSPRLYLGYGVGLFDPGEVITLRYLLSDDWSIEAVQDPEETRTGIQYEAER